MMKVGFVGVGSIGRACALALVGRGCAREIVLVDRTRTRWRYPLRSATPSEGRDHGRRLRKRDGLRTGNDHRRDQREDLQDRVIDSPRAQMA
jgi:hypothetical protein